MSFVKYMPPSVTEDLKFRLSYNPACLLDKQQHVPKYEKFKQALKDVKKHLTFKSRFLEEYFLKLSSPRYKWMLKLIVLMIIFMSYSFIVCEQFWENSESNRRVPYAGLLLMIAILGYGAAVRVLSPQNYNIVIIAIVVAVISLCFCYYQNVNIPIELMYLPSVPLILLMYSLSPLSMYICLSLASLIIVFQEILCYQRIQNLIKNPLTAEKSSSYIQQENDVRAKKFMMGKLILWISLNFVGIYIYLCSRVRRIASFLRLGDNIQAGALTKRARASEMTSLEIALPADIKDDFKRQKEANAKNDLWVYCNTYENVSILFGDIVGYTKLSANKSAARLVTILNDLFYRFDVYCYHCCCEPLGTLGDCYYCVSGCPKPRQDHAICCIEMGLGMCRVIQQFNEDYHEAVDMRIGIHTGIVTGAVLGITKYRFDIYSYDVIIANQVEAKSKPGKVQISEVTHDLVKHIYTFTSGQRLRISKAVPRDDAEYDMVTINLSTYFVDPESSLILQQGVDIDTTKQETNQSNSSFQQRSRKSSMNTEPKLEEEKQYLSDIEFLKNMIQNENDLVMFNNLRVWPFTLEFTDFILEKIYFTNRLYEVETNSIESIKVAPFLDCIACISFSILILAAAGIFLFDSVTFGSEILLIFFGIFIAMIILWASTRVVSMIESEFNKNLFMFVNNYMVQNAVAVYMSLLPTMIIFFIFDCTKVFKDDLYTIYYYSLCLFSLIGTVIYTSSSSLINIACGFSVLYFSSLTFIFPLDCIQLPCDDEKFRNCDLKGCKKLVYYDVDQIYYHYIVPMILNMLICFLLVCFISRDNEKTIRLSFFLCEDLKERRKEAEKALAKMQSTLHCFIPKYVLDDMTEKGNSLGEGFYAYAANVMEAGVVFACINNFFTNFYREDRGRGHGALQLLNKIICIFDEIQEKPKYHEIDKIKTVSDCYIVASGLNEKSIKRSPDKILHLRRLMEYCFEMKDALNAFNERYIFGKTKFEIKIGYNIGNVMTGIVGNAKPIYDIWGYAVNVASKMYSEAAPGIIQVPRYVETTLNDFIEFKRRNAVFIGKNFIPTSAAVRVLVYSNDEH